MHAHVLALLRAGAGAALPGTAASQLASASGSTGSSIRAALADKLARHGLLVQCLAAGEVLVGLQPQVQQVRSMDLPLPANSHAQTVWHAGRCTASKQTRKWVHHGVFCPALSASHWHSSGLSACGLKHCHVTVCGRCSLRTRRSWQPYVRWWSGRRTRQRRPWRPSCLQVHCVRACVQGLLPACALAASCCLLSLHPPQTQQQQYRGLLHCA